jgi:putative glycerol-1-phosphate prenyltransferase
MANTVYQKFKSASSKPQIALLIDPDECTKESVKKRIEIANELNISFIFLGGSLVTNTHFEECIDWIKAETEIPVVLFPGNDNQISPKADAILLLSLISGRNADLLIGKHVHTAPLIRQFNLESISTGYMLIESGPLTSVQYISNTMPIPRSKKHIALSTAMAGELIGMKALYLDAGSGAEQCVPSDMISSIKQHVDLPLIIGGGIRTIESAHTIAEAGADVIVFGNLAERDPSKFKEIVELLNK